MKLISCLLLLLLVGSSLAQDELLIVVSSLVNPNSPVHPQCSNGQWTLFGFGFGVTVQAIKNSGGVNQIGPINVPMDETITSINDDNLHVVLDIAFFLDGVAATPANGKVVLSTFETPNGFAQNGNVFSPTLADQQQPGGSFQLGSCAQGQTPPVVTISASSTTAITTLGNGKDIPSVTVNSPTVMVSGSLNGNNPPPSQTTTTSTGAPTSTGGSPSGGAPTTAGSPTNQQNNGAIIGGSFGGLLALAAAGVLMSKRRSSKQRVEGNVGVYNPTSRFSATMQQQRFAGADHLQYQQSSNPQYFQNQQYY
jgi:hypothetical protein